MFGEPLPVAAVMPLCRRTTASKIPTASTKTTTAPPSSTGSGDEGGGKAACTRRVTVQRGGAASVPGSGEGEAGDGGFVGASPKDMPDEPANGAITSPLGVMRAPHREQTPSANSPALIGAPQLPQ